MHPSESELERASECAGGAEVEEHLRRCARCRSVVADYRWLGGEIGAALTHAAEAVRVPHPRWAAVRGRMAALQQRQAVGWRVSAAASAMVAITLMLLVSPVLRSAAVAWTLPPEALGARAPVTAPPADCGSTPGQAPSNVWRGPCSVPAHHVVWTADYGLCWGATPTPALSSRPVTPSPTPALILPPGPQSNS